MLRRPDHLWHHRAGLALFALRNTGPALRLGDVLPAASLESFANFTRMLCIAGGYSSVLHNNEPVSTDAIIDHDPQQLMVRTYLDRSLPESPRISVWPSSGRSSIRCRRMRPARLDSQSA